MLLSKTTPGTLYRVVVSTGYDEDDLDGQPLGLVLARGKDHMLRFYRDELYDTAYDELDFDVGTVEPIAGRDE